ncbi:cytochrome P450 [Colletotrichum cuscutae]|uniref:Cytochrome P450 n=1 Tax=Colletotrichum cuscutae TaxID=1209917 RepID=A0AAI9YDR9_9PEZI|nr:cytochrome P450 [Colletotrichum cuscutae]
MNWTKPEEFAPERWIGEDVRFENNKRDTNLVYVEIKIIISRLLLTSLYNFVPQNALSISIEDLRGTLGFHIDNISRPK